MTKVDCVVANADRLGESPIWSVGEQALYWIDSRAPRIYRLDFASNAIAARNMPTVIGSIALRSRGGLLAATADGLFLSPSFMGEAQLVAHPERDKPGNRFNDGRCDRRGRFWAGTMSDMSRDPLGSLYRIAADLEIERMRGDIIVPNSIAFSPDDRAMYFADTYRAQILVYEFDIDAGAIRSPRLFADTRGRAGRPDGSAIDEDGCLWNAEYAGGRILRYTPRGDIDRIIELPVSQPTCCCFGGAQLDTLFITSATQRLTADALVKEPLAGALFACTPGVKGLPEAMFAG